MNWLTKLFCKHGQTISATELELAWHLPGYFSALKRSNVREIKGRVCIKCGKLTTYTIYDKYAIITNNMDNLNKYNKDRSFNWYHC